MTNFLIFVSCFSSIVNKIPQLQDKLYLFISFNSSFSLSSKLILRGLPSLFYLFSSLVSCISAFIILLLWFILFIFSDLFDNLCVGIHLSNSIPNDKLYFFITSKSQIQAKLGNVFCFVTLSNATNNT